LSKKLDEKFKLLLLIELKKVGIVTTILYHAESFPSKKTFYQPLILIALGDLHRGQLNLNDINLKVGIL
jgi:hypothetical protein